MWSDDDGPFEGEHYRLAETICTPSPVQAGGPPLLVGGVGERKTLRLVAQYADACNLFDLGPRVWRTSSPCSTSTARTSVAIRATYGAP